MPEPPKQKKPYRPPRLRSERVAPLSVLAGSGLGTPEPGEPGSEPRPQE